MHDGLGLRLPHRRLTRLGVLVVIVVVAIILCSLLPRLSQELVELLRPPNCLLPRDDSYRRRRYAEVRELRVYNRLAAPGHAGTVEGVVDSAIGGVEWRPELALRNDSLDALELRVECCARITTVYLARGL